MKVVINKALIHATKNADNDRLKCIAIRGNKAIASNGFMIAIENIPESNLDVAFPVSLLTDARQDEVEVTIQDNQASVIHQDGILTVPLNTIKYPSIVAAQQLMKEEPILQITIQPKYLQQLIDIADGNALILWFRSGNSPVVFKAGHIYGGIMPYLFLKSAEPIPFVFDEKNIE